MKKFAIGALCSVASLAFAQEGTMETTSMGTSPIKVFANVDLNITNIDVEGADVDTGYNLAVGTDGVYMLTDAMGVGLGLDFNMLKGESTGTELKATYLDIPVSFAYNLEVMPELSFMFLAGPFIGVPVSDWEAAGSETDATLAYGLNLETHATWVLTEGFALGGHLGFKYAFNDLTDESAAVGNTDVNYWAVGVGIGAKFL